MAIFVFNQMMSNNEANCKNDIAVYWNVCAVDLYEQPDTNHFFCSDRKPYHAFLSKYLIINFNGIDNLLLLFFPAITFSYFLLKRIVQPKVFLKTVLLTFLTVTLTVLSGIIIAIGTWTKSGSNPLLPGYIRYQPFSHYWTIFILLGIFIPIILHHFQKQTPLQNNQIIDV